MLKRDELGRHGHKGTTEYKAWLNLNKRHHVHQSLKDYVTFFNEVGNKPTSTHVLGMIDITLGWIPGNIQWVTRKEWHKQRRDRCSLLASTS